MSLFSSGKYSTIKKRPGENRMVIPDGSWVKCKSCSQTLYTDRLVDTLQVCWNCGAHLPMTAPDRIAMLSDEGCFEEMFGNLRSVDTLNFIDSKPYTARLQDSISKTGLNEAIICGKTAVEGNAYYIAVMDFPHSRTAPVWSVSVLRAVRMNLNNTVNRPYSAGPDQSPSPLPCQNPYR